MRIRFIASVITSIMLFSSGIVLAQDTGQEATSPADTETGEAAKSDTTESSPNEPPPVFVPNEKISPDTVISFPADI